ncbi:hypothetical protein [Plesiocystis pacifica]|uniref:hypothetical protein n=1 Tax=Plesiocystis pacifica TaxID=191768 RepID=UPI0012F7C18B|nr:hypothetical protein [Plesiocystis pacifica]
MASCLLVPSLASADVKPEISSPEDGAIVDTTFWVEVSRGTFEHCSVGGCDELKDLDVTLRANGKYAASADFEGQPSVALEVTLEPGEYELEADGEVSGVGKSITVTVEGPPDVPQPPLEDGCSVVDEGGAGLPLGGALMLFAGLWRRRRGAEERASASTPGRS